MDSELIATVLQRALTVAEQSFLSEMEGSGINIMAPPVEPEPTEADIIKRDGEHITIVPTADNAMGLPSVHIYRQGGRELVEQPVYAAVLRSQELVSLQPILVKSRLRAASGLDPHIEFASLQVSKQTIDIGEIAQPPAGHYSGVPNMAAAIAEAMGELPDIGISVPTEDAIGEVP